MKSKFSRLLFVVIRAVIWLGVAYFIYNFTSNAGETWYAGFVQQYGVLEIEFFFSEQAKELFKTDYAKYGYVYLVGSLFGFLISFTAILQLFKGIICITSKKCIECKHYISCKSKIKVERQY